MKTKDEIQLLHDTLNAALKGELPMRVDKKSRSLIEAQRSILCWVLQDESGQSLNAWVAELYRMIEADGLEAVKMAQPAKKETVH